MAKMAYLATPVTYDSTHICKKSSKAVKKNSHTVGVAAGVGVARSRRNEPGVGADHNCLDSDSGTLFRIFGIACLCN